MSFSRSYKQNAKTFPLKHWLWHVVFTPLFTPLKMPLTKKLNTPSIFEVFLRMPLDPLWQEGFFDQQYFSGSLVCMWFVLFPLFLGSCNKQKKNTKTSSSFSCQGQKILLASSCRVYKMHNNFEDKKIICVISCV